jgi:hypothetical protein
MLTMSIATSPVERVRLRPTWEEFHGAFLRLLERSGGLDWSTLAPGDLCHLDLLADDKPELLKWDQDVLHDWAEAEGHPMGERAYQPGAPVIYMAMRLAGAGCTDWHLVEGIAEALRVISRR